jgi:hypothetical protein
MTPGREVLLRLLIALAVTMAALLAVSQTAVAADVDFPRNASPAWFTDDFKQRVDASGSQGVPMDDHSVLAVCPGAVIHEGGVGTGTCIVHPFGCTANFVYYSGGNSVAGRVASGGAYHLGTAGHCVEKAGEPVYAAVGTPGVGPTIQRIGTVSRFVDDYPDDGNVHDFASIQIADGYEVYPQSPVGGPQGIYDGCQIGLPVKYYGHGYEAAVAQGKPGVGASSVWYDDAYGWAGPILGGDSGSAVMLADDRAAGNLTATAILYLPAFLPGESIGSRITWILEFLGSAYRLVNQDYTLARDTTSPCGDAGGDDGGGPGGGGKGGGGKGGGGKGGKPKS